MRELWRPPAECAMVCLARPLPRRWRTSRRSVRRIGADNSSLSVRSEKPCWMSSPKIAGRLADADGASPAGLVPEVLRRRRRCRATDLDDGVGDLELLAHIADRLAEHEVIGQMIGQMAKAAGLLEGRRGAPASPRPWRSACRKRPRVSACGRKCALTDSASRRAQSPRGAVHW